jgi:predicted phage terminase large subunit-like protein
MMRLLKGNWYARPKGSNYFDRSWLVKLDEEPRDGLCCRAWDKAASEPSEVERFPDFTASIKMKKTRSGDYVILGDYHPDNGETKLIRGRFRKTPGARDEIIKEQAIADGADCRVVLPVDVGAAGKTEYQESAKKLVAVGRLVKSDPMPTNKSKLTKFMPFSSAAENGLVYIVESSFPDLNTLNDFYKELEAFNGERSTRQRKDDWADATASAFNFLARERVVKLPCRNQKHSPTHAAEVLESHTTKTVQDTVRQSNLLEGRDGQYER